MSVETNLAECAYVIVESKKHGDRIGFVRSVEFLPGCGTGYYSTAADDELKTIEEVRELVKKLNDRIGVEPRMAKAMQIGSMFGRLSAVRYLQSEVA